MSRSSRRIVAIAGVASLLAYIAIYILSPPIGTPLYLSLVAVACAAYLAAISSMFAARAAPSGALLGFCVLLAAAFRVPLLLTGPGTDVYRYVWDAKVQRDSYNPYIVLPSDGALASLHTEETRRVNHADLPSPYGPGAQRFFRLVLHFSERAYAFKLALAAGDLAVAFVLWRWLLAIGVAPGWLIVYAWSPLVILATSGEGHLDVLGALWLMASVLLLTNGRRLSSALFFVMAIAVKPLPIVLLPQYWRRVRLRHAILGALLLATLYAPYVMSGRVPIGSMGAFVDRFRFNQAAFSVTSAALGARGAAGFAVVAGLIVSAALRRRLSVSNPAGWAWPLAVALALSPVVYPWYLVWLVPFAFSVTTLPLLVWSVAILATYVVWHLSQQGAPWAVPTAVLMAEFGAVMAAGAVALGMCRTREPESPRDDFGDRPDDTRTAPTLSVIVPTFEEESIIGETLAHTKAVVGDQEIIVIDGRSADRTPDIARQYARVITSSGTRGAALNEAASTATGDVLLFLHADTRLPSGAVDAIQRILHDQSVVGGAFRFSFDDAGWAARMIAIWVNARSMLMNVFFGDQAMFVRRDAFARAGGFKDWSVMEDLEILGRLRRFGRLQMVSLPIVTSARRHRQVGWLKTMGTIWLLTGLNLFGVPGPALARLYKPQR